MAQVHGKSQIGVLAHVGILSRIYNRRWAIPLLLCITSGCNAVEDREAMDTDVPDVVSNPLPGDATADTSALEDGYDAQDALDEVSEADTGPTPREYSHRAIGGVSMGAAAARIALEHPDLFDVGGALGGYISLQYMVSAGLRLQLGGFCDLDKLEANIDQINAIDAVPSVFCGPGKVLYDLEFSQDFNHLHHAVHGADFNRRFYIDVFRALSLGFGNFTTEPDPESPYLPLGSDPSWFTATSSEDKCANPMAVPPLVSFNAEYNPNGQYPVIPFCDSDTRLLEGLLGADYDPTAVHTYPTEVLLAVDINGNGRRDYGEPVFLNATERYADVGTDGCANVMEDGEGGCLPTTQEPVKSDPNGDDFHWLDNPLGTELNDRWDPGEPYDDNGLDGVLDTNDVGESNGIFDTNSALVRAKASDVSDLIMQLSDEALSSLDLYFDSGIRDPLHAAVSTRFAVAALNGRKADVQYFQGIADRPTALFPTTAIEDVVNELGNAALFSKESMGTHVYVEYGDPDASQEALDAGDGGHLGTIEEVLSRMLTWCAFALHRLPEPDTEPTETFNVPESRSYFSEIFGARRNYTIVLPPGYDANPEKRYPVLYLLHGLGQSPSEFANVAFVTGGLMANGLLPKAIQVYVDGTCCRVRKDNPGLRECACGDRTDGVRQCVDPQCTGPHESCEVRDIVETETESECVRASLYLDLLTDRWGKRRDNMKYGTAVVELVEHIDTTYRTRAALPAR